MSTYLFSGEFPIINEVMYNPSTPITRRKWVEIYNPSMFPWSLHGWMIQTAGTEFRTDFTFPDIWIEPNQYIVIGESNVTFADFTAVLNIPNTNNVTKGVRLISNDGRFVDTILWDFPNVNNLPDDANNPAFQFVLPSPQGYSLARRPNGFDSNSITDWESTRFPSPGTQNFNYIDLSISDLYLTNDDIFNTLHIVIHNLSTGTVDNSLLILRVFHNEKTLFDSTPNILFNNQITVFAINVDLIKNALNSFIVEISYPQDVDISNNTKRLSFFHGFTPLIMNELQYQPIAPEPEWIEFFNRSDEVFIVENAYILNASGRRSYFNAVIEPLDYLIITQNRQQFSSIHPLVDMNKVIQPNTWAILNNARDTIQLFLAEDARIDSLSYVGVAAQRGRSLERVNPWSDENIQWLHSIAPIGSTPQSKNSQTPADYDAQITDVSIFVEDNQLRHEITITNIGLMSNFEGSLHIYHKSENTSEYQLIYNRYIWINQISNELTVTSFPSERGYHYFMYRLQWYSSPPADWTVHQRLSTVNIFTRTFLNGNPPVVVNEFMYNPSTGEPMWVEFIKTRDVMPEKGLKFFVQRDSIHVPYFEGDFALLTVSISDVAYLRENYNIPDNISIFRGLRNLLNAGATLILKDYDENLYEEFHYLPSFSPRRGFSAERISPILPPEEQNWAASLYGSTPARRNSVHMNVIPSTSSLDIENNPFSPYRHEHCIIKINVNEQRVRADVTIFDIKGREVITLANKTIIPGEYAFIWNGRDRNGSIVNPGVYPVFVNIERLNGTQVYQSRKLIYVGR